MTGKPVGAKADVLYHVDRDGPVTMMEIVESARVWSPSYVERLLTELREENHVQASNGMWEVQ